MISFSDRADEISFEVISYLSDSGKYDKHFNDFAPERLTVKAANRKAQEEINSPDVGYCLQAVTSTLNKALPELLPDTTKDKDGNLLNLSPAEFLQKLKEDDKFKDAIYDNLSDPAVSFQDIITESKIQPVAVILLEKDGKAQHAMFWDGSKDAENNAVLRGFNGQSVEEEHNVDMSKGKGGGLRKGYIIDLYSVIDKHPEMVEGYYKRVKDDYYTKKAIEEAKERIAAKKNDRTAATYGSQTAVRQQNGLLNSAVLRNRQRD